MVERMDKLVEQIGELIALQEKSARIIEAEYAEEVAAIIRQKSKDKQRIEKALDVLLDYSYDSVILEIFRKLCKYYYNIDPQSTCFYIQGYRELWDNEGNGNNQ